MNSLRAQEAPTCVESDWMPFPGGELEGKRPRALCPACRSRKSLARAGLAPAGKPAICFQCYRAELERNRQIEAAGALNTASEARFQGCLPFEPVNAARLQMLKTDRAAARAAARSGAGAFVERRRRAQIEARHALARVIQGLKERDMLGIESAGRQAGRAVTLDGGHPRVAAAHAADLQLPESWLPFVAAQ
jgi:hypothetical protein